MELESAREQLSEQLSDERMRHSRHVEALKSQSEWYLKRLADRSADRSVFVYTFILTLLFN